MGRKGKEIIAFLLALLFAMPAASAQKTEQKDSLVRLIKASNIQLMEVLGKTYRRSIDATFLHNGTYLKCDTALWDVANKIINARGHVQLIQKETILTSDKMQYYVDDNMVQCRGSLVQLQDKERNTLRTHYLDYNTQDSIAFFSNGASMRDKDGQIIESIDGSYDARSKIFTFRNQVNMFTDSVFIKTSKLDYRASDSRADFLDRIDFWKEENMLTADGGWYLRGEETFFFRGNVHGLTKAQEGWSDSLYYYRIPNDVLMMGRAQVQDTTRDVAAVANRIHYIDTLSEVRLTRDAAVALRTKEDKPLRDSLGNQIGTSEKIDTLYMGGDAITYRTIPKCDVPQGVFAAAQSRLADMHTDPVQEYRGKAAAAAAQAAAQQKAEMQSGMGGRPSAPESTQSQPEDSGREGPAEPADEAGPTPSDSLFNGSDSLLVQTDTLVFEPERDTTSIGFLKAVGNVKIYRKDIQIVCDSLRYNDIDSVARFYIDPVAWSEGRRQYFSDSLFALVKNQSVERVSMQSNAFVITQEAETLFDQIKATEVMAYFDTTGALRRFDALGGASAIFFLKEKEEIATVNKVESKMLSATFKDNELNQVFYYDSPKNDAYPIPQLRQRDRELKGFHWYKERQPQGREDITDLTLRPSQRAGYESRPKATFDQTDIYFPGYMKGVYKSIEDSRRRRQASRAEGERQEETAVPVPDAEVIAPDAEVPASETEAVAEETVTVPADTVAAATPVLDSVSVRETPAAADTSAAAAVKPHVPTKEELRAARKADQERIRAEKEAAREARWKELDERDAAKAAAKAAKKQAKEQARIKKLLQRQAVQDAKDRKKLERYVERYRKKKAREDARAAAKAARAAARAAARSEKDSGKGSEPEETNNTINDGNNTEPLPPLRGSGHPE